MSVLIIAEAGVNHNGSLELAKRMALAAKEAGADVVKYQTAVPELVIADGNRTPPVGVPVQAIVKGDGKSACIAAASVLAQVSRDAFCAEMDALYPQYGFAVHKGYATKAHREAILRYGPCPIHRKSFLKKLSGKAP